MISRNRALGARASSLSTASVTCSCRSMIMRSLDNVLFRRTCVPGVLVEPPRQDKKLPGTPAARARSRPGCRTRGNRRPAAPESSVGVGRIARIFIHMTRIFCPVFTTGFAKLAASSRQSFVQVNSNCTTRGSAAFTSCRHHSCLYVGLSNGGCRGQADVGGRRARKRGPARPNGHVHPVRTAGVLARLEDQQDDRIRARVRAVLVVPALMMR